MILVLIVSVHCHCIYINLSVQKQVPLGKHKIYLIRKVFMALNERVLSCIKLDFNTIVTHVMT